MANFEESLWAAAARSPLERAKHGRSDSVILCEVPFVPTHDLRVKPGTLTFSMVTETLGIHLPTVVGNTQGQENNTPKSETHALCLGPDWWLLFNKPDSIQVLAPLRAEHHFSIVDVSAQRTHLEIKGPKARQVLEHVWEQDLRENRFVIGSCSQGLMAKAPAVLWHRGEHHYHIAVRASFAGHLWAALRDASTEYLEITALT